MASSRLAGRCWIMWPDITPEMFEIIGDYIDEVTEWEAYEADMDTNPFNDPFFTR